MDVPVTRQGAIGAVTLLMIVLAAVIIWEGSKAVNAEFHARNLIAGRPFIKGIADLLVGGEPPTTSQERLERFWLRNHRAIALFAMLIASILLVVRYLLLGRILDYLYLESEAREKRIYTGFLITLLVALGHAGTIYAAVILSQGTQAALVPVAMLALMAINFLWFVGTLASARRGERFALRGVWALCATSLVFAVLLFSLIWRIESNPTSNEAMRGSQVVLLTAAVALCLSLTDAFLQGRIYVSRRLPPGPLMAGIGSIVEAVRQKILAGFFNRLMRRSDSVRQLSLGKGGRPPRQ